MRMKCVSLIATGLLMSAVAFGICPCADGSAIGPGFDLFQTDPLSSYFVVDMGNGPLQVPLMGDPGPILDLGLGLAPNTNTDTIIQRVSGIDPFDPPNGSGTVGIELVALSLRSVEPVAGALTLWDVQVRSGSLFGIPNGTGSMDVLHTTGEGGQYTSIVPIQLVFTYTEVGNPGNSYQSVWDRLYPGGGDWFHDPFQHNQNNPLLPSGGFHSGPVVYGDVGFQLGLGPATPAPGTLVILVMGGLIGQRRRRLRSPAHLAGGP